MASSQGFSFPPPPPPPPPSTARPQYAQSGSYTPQHDNHNGFCRGGGGAGRGGPAGSGIGGFRGRNSTGTMNRGGRGGPAHHQQHHHHANNTRGNFQVSYTGEYTRGQSNFPQYHQNHARYNTPAMPNFASMNQGFSTPAQVVTPLHSTYPSQQHNGRMRSGSISSTPTIPSANPAVIVPPMHWGYDQTGAGGFYSSSTPSNQQQQQQESYRNIHDQKHRQKRPFGSAFGKPTSQIPPRPTAPPAVPSFGVPLPAKPPQPATDTTRQTPKKKKRKYNQLGLTPKTENYESSGEEEDDADEETRLASAAAGHGSGPLQFTFRGRTATLNNAAEIQAWIEERKKRFPTQVRIEEKKKAQEEAKRQRDLEREEMRRKQQELKEKREQGRKQAQEQKRNIKSDPMDAALKAKAKAEKLRKKLLKEERRLHKAEADAERARLVAEASQQNNPAAQQEVSHDSSIHATTEVPTPAIDTVAGDDDISNVSGSTSSEDESSNDDDDNDNDNDGPEEMSSRRQGPERVAPAPRVEAVKRSKPCRDFQRRGKCPRGDHCRFSHDTSSGKPGPKPKQAPPPPAKRGLYQMLVEQEIQARDRQVMQAICWLGSRGLLEDAQPQPQPQPQP